MPDHDNDIAALLSYLSSAAENPSTKTPIGITAAGFYAALTALVAERNALIADRTALIADRTALIAECDGLRSDRKSIWQINREQITELAAMREQRDEARRDAERYRWLKSPGCYRVEIQSQPRGDYIFQGQARHDSIRNCEMDDAIDRVIATQKEGGGA